MVASSQPQLSKTERIKSCLELLTLPLLL